MQLPGKAGGAVAVRRTLASTICWIADPTQVSRPRQLRDASTVMRLRPAHQSVINRRFNDRASCPTRHSLKQALERKPRTRLPATWNGGHESGSTVTPLSLFDDCIGSTLRDDGMKHRCRLPTVRISPEIAFGSGVRNDGNEATSAKLGSRPSHQKYLMP